MHIKQSFKHVCLQLKKIMKNNDLGFKRNAENLMNRCVHWDCLSVSMNHCPHFDAFNVKVCGIPTKVQLAIWIKTHCNTQTISLFKKENQSNIFIFRPPAVNLMQR